MDSVGFGLGKHILKVVSILNQGQGIIPQKETEIARQTEFGAKLEQDNYSEYIVRMSVPLSGPRYIFLGQDQLCGHTLLQPLTLSDCSSQCSSVTVLPLLRLVFSGAVRTYVSHTRTPTVFRRRGQTPLIAVAPVKPSSRKRWPLEPRSLDLCPAQLLI